MSQLALYVPGDSLAHRLPAGAKLLALVGLGVLLQLLRPWFADVLVLVAVAALYPLNRLRLGLFLRQLQTLAWVLVPLVAVQTLVSGWRTGVSVFTTVLVLVLAAGLVTSTTTVTAMTDALSTLLRPLRRFGVDPERVSLLLALSMRSVPVVLQLAAQVRDAQRARGLDVSPRAFVTPLLICALRHAERVGDALVARGVDDD